LRSDGSDCQQRSLEAAKARRAGERLKFRTALFLGEGEPGLGVASLGGLVADIKGDGSALLAGLFSDR
jgi:hypothetical protein